MGFFDFVKKKEMAEIENLKEEISRHKNQISSLSYECCCLSKFKDISDLDLESRKIIAELESERKKIQSDKAELCNNITSLQIEVKGLNKEILDKKKMVIELDETILLQDFGLYSPIYDFANSEQYKDLLDRTRQKQKDMILSKVAATCSQEWTINGSEEQGRIMTNQNIKQILRCFNDECDILVDKVKFNNIEAYKNKIEKSYNALNKMNTKNAVSISYSYFKLKIDELEIAYEYALKKQQEKEEQKRIREQLREEAKLQKEIEEARKDIEKEQKHYSNALDKLNKQLTTCDDVEKDILLEKKTEIEQHLSELDTAIKDIDYREANKKAGYVYVISNIGSFGENVYKIGMTRRLDPMERVDELGDASVPFKFDVHALVFSDDAPKLEAALHRAFENKKVNMINNRREFFKVTLDEVEEVIKNNYDKTVDFEKIAQAEQYRESIKIRNNLNGIS